MNRTEPETRNESGLSAQGSGLASQPWS